MLDDLYRALLGVPGVLVTVASKGSRPLRLDTSVGVSGPHGFVERPHARFVVACSKRPSQPVSRIATMAERPSWRGGIVGNVFLICRFLQVRNMRQNGTTGNLRMADMRGLPITQARKADWNAHPARDTQLGSYPSPWPGTINHPVPCPRHTSVVAPLDGLGEPALTGAVRVPRRTGISRFSKDEGPARAPWFADRCEASSRDALRAPHHEGHGRSTGLPGLFGKVWS
jgi:hypothetical protein